MPNIIKTQMRSLPSSALEFPKAFVLKFGGGIAVNVQDVEAEKD
jgi:hypothetical protein